MRVISGKARGRILKIPPEKISRPTADRVKEALFNILGERVLGSVFLDCFAGSGSIGIEALSRGAKRAHFIENNPVALKVLKDNLEKTGLLSLATIWKGKAGVILSRRLKGVEFDIIFLDPPYSLNPFPFLELIETNKLIGAKGIVILEGSRQSPEVDCAFWRIAENRVYGDTRISIWQKE